MSEVKKKSVRRTVGAILKNKDVTKPDYIKIGKDGLSLKPGQILNLESKTHKLESLESAIAAGKISGDYADKRREQIERHPDFVRFDIVLVGRD